MKIIPSTFLSAAFLLPITLLPVSLAHAEIYECEGKWTNKPCNGSVTKSIEETGSAVPADENVKAIREKTSLLHDLRMKQIQAREVFGIRFDLTAVENFCLKSPSSVEECARRIDSVGAQLEKQMTAADALASQRRANELQEEHNRLQEEQNRIESEKPNIAIVEDYRRIIVVPRDHDHHDFDHRPDRSHDHGGSASINVQGSGTNGNGSISVGGSVSTHVGESHVGSYGGRCGSDHAPIIINPVVPRADNGVVVHDNFGNPKKIDGVKPGPFAK